MADMVDSPAKPMSAIRQGHYNRLHWWERYHPSERFPNRHRRSNAVHKTFPRFIGWEWTCAPCVRPANTIAR